MITTLAYCNAPVQDLSHHPVAENAGVRLLVKREDLNHPTVSGNKWWKLKHNLEEVAQSSHRTLLTFGGAYSNHIRATAAAAWTLGLKSIGLIRGERHTPLNATLRFARDNGMQLHYIDRTAYRGKASPDFQEWIQDRFGPVIVLPEGGSNFLAIKGCAEFAATKLTVTSYDHLCLAVGTGGTMAGIICGLDDDKHVIGIPVLKGGGFLKKTVADFIHDFSKKTFNNWSLLTNYHHGGYGKTTPELMTFIDDMEEHFNLPLDHVYTAKLFWGVLHEIAAGSFKRGDTILVLHSGGLQGNARKTES